MLIGFYSINTGKGEPFTRLLQKAIAFFVNMCYFKYSHYKKQTQRNHHNDKNPFY